MMPAVMCKSGVVRVNYIDEEPLEATQIDASTEANKPRELVVTREFVTTSYLHV